jgi:exopolyphosphatase/guanosine-5'-triphosphate,3'-diphosphate pyrophosphatase
MNLAAVDIGTNSVRLLITDAAGQQLERHMQITRLGQGVDVTGRLHPDALARTLAVLDEYGQLIRRYGATRVRAVATSAARDAANSGEFFSAAERALGARPELLSGEDEAALSFAGATVGLDPADGPFLVVDIGGGSTEFVLGSRAPEGLISLDMGCVRMTERHLKSDPPTQQELEACAADVRANLGRVRRALPVERARRMIGLAGTITALAYMQRGLDHYAPELTHRSLLGRADVEQLFERLASVDVATRRGMLIEPKRAEVIVGGVVVLREILREFGIEELMVSESDILDGLAASLR